MLTLNLNHNYNGKLFADHFSHLQVCSPDFYVGAEGNILYRSIPMGIARIEALKEFRFDRLSDVVSFLNMGRPAVFQAAMLNKIYNGGKALPGDTTLVHLVLGYVKRDIENHSRLINEWRDSKKKVNANNN